MVFITYFIHRLLKVCKEKIMKKKKKKGIKKCIKNSLLFPVLCELRNFKDPMKPWYLREESRS